MNIQNGWTTAKAVNGDIIKVNVIPMNKPQRNLNGPILVEVAKQVLLESGETLNFNLDGKSFYTEINKLYRLFN